MAILCPSLFILNHLANIYHAIILLKGPQALRSFLLATNRLTLRTSPICTHISSGDSWMAGSHHADTYVQPSFSSVPPVLTPSMPLDCSYPEERIQGAILHELRDDHDRPTLGNHALQANDVGVVKLAHDARLAQKVPTLLLWVASLQRLNGHIDFPLAWKFQTPLVHLSKLSCNKNAIITCSLLGLWNHMGRQLIKNNGAQSGIVIKVAEMEMVFSRCNYDVLALTSSWKTKKEY